MHPESAHCQASTTLAGLLGHFRQSALRMTNPIRYAIGHLVRIPAWVTRRCPQFQMLAINNPLKGFRDYKKDGYGLSKRQYIRWDDIRSARTRPLDRIIAHHKYHRHQGRRFEGLKRRSSRPVLSRPNWRSPASKKGSSSIAPADLHTFDYDSAAFHDRLRRLVEKPGQAWDEDPASMVLQMGLIRVLWRTSPSRADSGGAGAWLATCFRKHSSTSPCRPAYGPEIMEVGSASTTTSSPPSPGNRQQGRRTSIPAGHVRASRHPWVAVSPDPGRGAESTGSSVNTASRGRPSDARP